MATLWRSRLNVSLPSEQQIQTLTLDYEFKTMAPGWPASASGETTPSRLVLKQARSLDPGLSGIPPEVLDLLVPRDFLARTRLVVEISCDASGRIEIFTAPVPDRTTAGHQRDVHVTQTATVRR